MDHRSVRRNGTPALVEEAAEQLLACRRVPHAARAFHHAAVEAASGGDEDAARRLAKAASELYETLDADLWRRQLIADLRSLGLDVRPRRKVSRAVDGWASLTASEEAVVGLVGQGLTNSEIAERLFVSRRTVESHLRRVYPKLHLTARAQLVSVIARRTLA